MPHYRVYFLDRDNKISKAADTECATDDDALVKIVSFRYAGAIELWQGIKCIKRIEPTVTMARLLIVDDNDLVRSMLQRELEREGFSVTVAVDGEDGLDKFKRQPFDLVISDIFMPKDGAIGIVHNIRRLSPDTPIVVTTGAELTREEIARVLGPVPIIFKPFRTPQLLALIRECLR